jgi:hypothetical protein
MVDPTHFLPLDPTHHAVAVTALADLLRARLPITENPSGEDIQRPAETVEPSDNG